MRRRAKKSSWIGRGKRKRALERFLTPPPLPPFLSPLQSSLKPLLHTSFLPPLATLSSPFSFLLSLNRESFMQ